MGFDEERRSFSLILAEPGGRSGELHQELEPERRERFLVEGLASLVVGNGEPDVIERDHQLSFGGRLALLPDDRFYRSLAFIANVHRIVKAVSAHCRWLAA
jgi:hypothetical protein